MPVSTIEEHVDSLLQRRVAESKRGGAPQPDLEAAAIFDAVAMNLILRPRTALYFMLLARNGLTQAVQGELDIIEEVLAAIEALGNQSFKIEGAPVLEKARTSLLNIESLPRLTRDSVALDRYGKAVNEFLEKHLARNVRKEGSSVLVTPSAEALAGLPAYSTSLNDKHQEVLRRLYTLAVGVDNFETAPFSAILGTTTVNRVRTDLESIIDHITASGDPAPSRDFAVRLISSVATLGSVAAPPSWNDQIVTEASAYTPNAAPVATSTVVNDDYGPGTDASPMQISVSGHGSISAVPIPTGEQLSASDLSAVLNALYGTLITSYADFDLNGDMVVRVESNFSDPGQELAISAPSGYGLSGTYAALSESVTVVLEDAVLSQVQIGDKLSTSAGAETFIIGTDGIGTFTVSPPIPTFSGSVSVDSALVSSYSAFIAELTLFLAEWRSVSFAADLKLLDRAFASLLASQAPSQRNTAANEATRLKTELTKLLNVLTNPSTMLPDGAGLNESLAVDGILTTLYERGFSRAAALLLEGDIASMLEVTSDTASYGGTLLRAASDIASTFDTTPTSVSGRPDAVSAGGSNGL